MAATRRENFQFAFEATLKGLFPDTSYELLPDGKYNHHSLQRVFEGRCLGIESVEANRDCATDRSGDGLLRLPVEPTPGMLAPFLLNDQWDISQAKTQYRELFDALLNRTERQKFETAMTRRFGPGKAYHRSARFALLGWQVARAYRTMDAIYVDQSALKKTHAFAGFIGDAVLKSFVRILRYQAGERVEC